MANVYLERIQRRRKGEDDGGGEGGDTDRARKETRLFRRLTHFHTLQLRQRREEGVLEEGTSNLRWGKKIEGEVGQGRG